MKKIISLFQRNYNGDRQVRDEVVPGAEWVIAGEGMATRKWDGTPVLVQDGKLYKRYDVKHGKTAPDGAIKITDTPDPNTGHWPWWVPIGDGKEDKLFHDAYANTKFTSGVIDQIAKVENGTYELVGPKINGNKDQFTHHLLLRHGHAVLANPPRTFTELKEWFRDVDIEGIVWHHPDGRMVKIKKKDFGYKR